MKFQYVIFVLAMSMGVFDRAQAQTTSQDINIMMNQIYPDNLPGAALLVIRDGRLVISKGYGLAVLSPKQIVTSNTHFRMASVSKQFTAMCILFLQKQGKLNLSDKAIQYLPSLPACAGDITIEQLLTHTSGIEDYESLIPKDQREQISDADVLQLIGKSDSLYFSPGSQFRYSNTGFCLLTQIVEKVSGLAYPVFVRNNIFLPAGMRNTTIYEKDKNIYERAFGYHRDGDQWSFADQSVTSATMGDGSVYTSVNEYQQWLQWLWKQKFTKGEANPLAAHATVKPGLNYGYGWFITQEKDSTTACFHSGESTGFHNIVYQNPSKKLAIVLFSNCDDSRVSMAFDEIMTMLRIQLPGVAEGGSLFDFLSRIYGN